MGIKEAETLIMDDELKGEDGTGKDGGFHSVLKHGQLQTGKRIIEKDIGIAGGLEPRVAMDLVDLMRRYVETAREIGVNVREPVGYYLKDNSVTGRATLVEVVPNVGINLKTKFSDPSVSDREVLEDIGQYLGLYQKVWENGFGISLDPPVANFCVDDKGKIWYVDCIPPRQRLPDSTLLSEWPDPPAETKEFIEYRYFSERQVEVIYAQLLRAVVDKKLPSQSIKGLIRERLGEDAYKRVNLTKEGKLRILHNPRRTDVDLIRIIAGEAVVERKISVERMKEIYRETHIGAGGILPEKETVVGTVNTLKNWIYG